MMTSFDNNEDKVWLLFKDDVGRSHVRSRTRSCVESHDHKCRDYGITIAFVFGVSSDKQIIVKKLFATG